MAADRIDRSEGRRLFGANPLGYDSVRPDYPPALFDFAAERGVVFEGAETLEIGAGNGLATRPLLERGVNPLTVVEPDRRFEPMLAALLGAAGAETELLSAPFEDCALAPATFGLVVSATAFHWLAPDIRCSRFADLLRPGGHAMLLWNVFQVLGWEDPYHDATDALLAPLESSPSAERAPVPFALDRQARLNEFAQIGAFESGQVFAAEWTLELKPAQVGTLYEGFSAIQRLSEDARRRLLDQLMEIAETQFDGRVERNMTSIVYLFERSSA